MLRGQVPPALECGSDEAQEHHFGGVRGHQERQDDEQNELKGAEPDALDGFFDGRHGGGHDLRERERRRFALRIVDRTRLGIERTSETVSAESTRFGRSSRSRNIIYDLRDVIHLAPNLRPLEHFFSSANGAQNSMWTN